MMMLIRRTALVLALITISGCMHWKPVRPLPRAEQDPVSLRGARVTMAAAATPMRASTALVLRDVRITADSVIGWGEGPDDRIALHRSQVRGLESRSLDPWRTAGATVLVLLAAYAGAVWWAVTHMEW
jgi:hypothetical protein